MTADLLKSAGLPDRALAGRAVLITGAAGGIGGPLAEACARLGARVAVTDLKPVAPLVASLTAAGAEAVGMVADLTDAGAVEAVIDRAEEAFGRLDIFVHLAAAAEVAPMFDLKADSWQQAYNLHVTALWLFGRRLVPRMREAGYGVFCTAASAPITPFVAAYGCSKMAARAFISNLAAELGAEAGVHVFGYMPGTVDTGLLRHVVESVSRVTGVPAADLFAQVGQNRGYPGLVPPQHSAVALAAQLVHASSLHGQIADPFTHLIGAGIAPLPDAKPQRPDGPMTVSGQFADLIADLNETVELRIERRTRELAEQAERLDRSVKELQTFSYSVSHDLRGPLHALSCFAELLHEHVGSRLDPVGNEYLARIGQTAQRMGDVISATLSLARLENASLAVETVDLAAIARELIKELGLHQGEVASTWVIAPDMKVAGDPKLLRLLLQNLLENAYKFTAHKPHRFIEIGRADSAQGPAFFVRDNGIGFDPAYAQAIFEPFRRLNRQSDYPGSGIGLATVRRIVEHHRGRLWADGAPGTGATIWFHIPADPKGDT